jgi:hypothetical protein
MMDRGDADGLNPSKTIFPTTRRFQKYRSLLPVSSPVEFCVSSGFVSPETMVAPMDCTGDVEDYVSFSVSQDSEEEDIVGNFFDGTKSVRNI